MNGWICLKREDVNLRKLNNAEFHISERITGMRLGNTRYYGRNSFVGDKSLSHIVERLIKAEIENCC